MRKFATLFALPLLAALALVLLLAAACASEGMKHHNRGVELADQGRWEEAIVEFDKAIELDGDPLSYMARGTSYGQLDDFTQAIDDFDKAIELDPSLGDAYAERAATYILLGDTEQALADLQTALSIVDDDSIRAGIKVLIEELGGELPEGELSRKRCEELSDVKPGNLIVFEGDLTDEEKIECARLLSE
jgi:tetratricopeptide (TPR) repeat protein